ncbi:MAG: glycoside hydrolase family 25 protein [Lachnospiraceae bacterium]|nr:glycoside hydrolase family 25 protein [Lachnospiraceae bacterium]
MRLSDDYEENSGWNPTVVTAIVAVTMVVGIILVIVLLANDGGRRKRSGTNAVQTYSVSAEQNQNTSPIDATTETEYPDLEDIVTGSTLTPDDLDFWDLYPPKVETVPAQREPDAVGETGEAGEEAEDPSKDGKHTLVTYADGKEEWVLISPYLPKHEYDFTKLVCQDNLMKYYEDGRQVSFVGVDISKYQDYVDFVKLKKAGIDFVMIRVGARGYGSGQLVLDEYFAENIKRATDAGLQIGVYFFSQAISQEEAVEEAMMVLENLGEYQLAFPVAFDMESIPNDTARIDVLSKSEKTTIAKTFMDTMIAAGYKSMLYGNKEWLLKEVDLSKLADYDVWLSQPGDIPDYPYKFAMWQYSVDASIDGIAGYADLNISFIDYAEK